KSGKE
ncbi:hypothetical protein D043_3427B, partial [Vibrio parahaemolyticus EKP-021]